MSILNLDLSTYKQNFEVSAKNKQLYGEVHTDFKLINNMLDLIPKKYYENPNLTWLDPCCGRGYFTIVLYKRLFSSLSKLFPEPKKRHDHIITNMIHMIELNSTFIPTLKNIFGENSNIYNENFLDHEKNKYNFVIGNPPYNSYHVKNEPGHINIWQAFIKKAFMVLKSKGSLLFITPSIWMKNTHTIFPYMLQYNIKKLHTMNNQETSRLFHGKAQIPSCYFLITKILRHKHPRLRPISIYDKSIHKYIKFNTNMTEHFTRPMSLPLFAVSIVQKIQESVRCYGPIQVKKTNIRPERISELDLSTNLCDKYPYPNIFTCKLRKTEPYLDINYSNIKCPFYNKPKIVLAHKMYGLPYYDKEGKFGISGRDNFIILNKTNDDFMRLKQFLSSNLFLTLTEAVRYRMSYMEQNLFDMIPDITNIPDFPINITNESIANYFNLNKMERNLIDNHKKVYLLNKF